MEDQRTGIRLAGLGGQGILMAGLLLGDAAVRQGLYAAGAGSYGSQSRGSLCAAEVLISKGPIDFPRVELATLLVALCQEGYDACAGQIIPGGRIFYDAGLVARRGVTQGEAGFNAAAESLRLLNSMQCVNAVWTGIVAGATGWFTEQSLAQAIHERMAKEFIDLNIRALRLGIEMGTKRFEIRD